MKYAGPVLCARYAYPPNSLHLCGPEKVKDLQYYSKSLIYDKGTYEIIKGFKTLYPYLLLIASENHIKDPFHPKVVDAYWIGNNLLTKINFRNYAKLLEEKFLLNKRIKSKQYNKLIKKVIDYPLPNHAFHVLNIYKRTNHSQNVHSLESMNMCLINYGQITYINNNSIIIIAKLLKYFKSKLVFGKIETLNILPQATNDQELKLLSVGDFISFHWGYLCEKLNIEKLNRLKYYNQLALNFANN
jgi:hypothetical protein